LFYWIKRQNPTICYNKHTSKPKTHSNEKWRVRKR
jgi:hypothetical protein